MAAGVNHLLPLVLLIALAATAFVPLGFVVRAAVRGNFGGVRALIDDPLFPKVLKTTIWLGLGSVAVALTTGTLLAWWAHTLPKGRRWMGVVPLFPLIVPPLASVIGYIFLLSPRVGFGNAALRTVPPFDGLTDGPFDVYSVPWMILITGFLLSSFVFLFVRTSLAQLHQELFDAAAMNAAGPIRTFWSVVLPLVRPAMVYGGITTLLLALGQFTVPLFLGRQTSTNVLSTRMYFEANRYPPNTALAAAYGLPIMVAGLVLLVLQNVVLGRRDRYTTSVGKGGTSLRPTGRIAQSCLVAYGICAVLLPLTALTIVSLQPSWSQHVKPGSFTLDAYREVFVDNGQLTEAIVNSVKYGCATVLVVLVVGYVCARQIYRAASPLSRLLEAVVMLPLGVPAVILGVGFLLAFTQGPVRLYATDLGMVVVYSTLLLPFSARMQLTAMTGIGEDLQNAAAVNGAGLFRRTASISLPMMRPAFGSVAALVLIMTTHEFSASLLVRSVDTQVMGSVMYELWEVGGYPETAVMALVMCAVTAICVIAATRVGGTSIFGEVA